MKQTFLKFGQLFRANPSPLDQETSFGLLLSEGAKEQTTTAGEAFPVFHRAGRDQTCVFCIFLLQSHRDMMCFQSPDWRFKWSVHFLRGLSVFLKSHELFQVVSVGAGTILANGTELNILPLGPGVITYLPPWKLVWVHSFPRRWAWTSCQGGLVDMLCRYYYHNWVEDFAKSFEMLAKWLKQPKYLHFLPQNALSLHILARRSLRTVAPAAGKAGDKVRFRYGDEVGNKDCRWEWNP